MTSSPSTRRVESAIPETAATFPPTAQITVEQLLNMTSGLPDYANPPASVAAQAAQDPTKVWTPNDLIAAALDAAPVLPPGTPGYSTTNYTLLGWIIEQVTGEQLEEVITDVATQAGLTNTALRPGDQNNLPDPSSHGYFDEAALEELSSLGVEAEVGTDVTDWSVSWAGGGGGMYSTLDDLFAWTATAMGTTLLPADLGEQRLMFNTDLADDGFSYGLGIIGVPLLPGWIGHGGGPPGGALSASTTPTPVRSSLPCPTGSAAPAQRLKPGSTNSSAEHLERRVPVIARLAPPHQAFAETVSPARTSFRRLDRWLCPPTSLRP